MAAHGGRRTVTRNARSVCSTQTVAPMDAETLTFTVTFNRCTAFALLNFKATSIRAVVKDGDGLVMYDRTVNTLKDVDGYWKYLLPAP